MKKWQVNIFGVVPDTLEIEAETAQDAEEAACVAVLEILDFTAELDGDNPDEDQPVSPPPPEAKEKRKGDSWPVS
ncbi:MAG TPA: hypothetical protein VGH83_05845 [Candidatus Acidoferrum sp.]